MELKNTITELKSTIKEFNSRLDEAQERIMNLKTGPRTYPTRAKRKKE